MRLFLVPGLLAALSAGVALQTARPGFCDEPGRNLIANGTLDVPESGGQPSGFQTVGAVRYGYLGHARADISSRGYWLQSSEPSGELSCKVGGLNAQVGKWFRFTFRGLPQSNFAVTGNDLYIKVAFFGKNRTVSYDAKEKKVYEQIVTARRDLSVNGNRRMNGAATWHTYQLDFMLPFPQVDEVKLSVGFGHGAAKAATDSAFMIDDLQLLRIAEPPGLANTLPPQPGAITPTGELLPLGGRWFYMAKPGEKTAPKTFTTANVDQLLYRDAVLSAPFAGNTSAWLRIGNMDANGSVVQKDQFIGEQVRVVFNGDVMEITTHGVPNHPTGRFPEQGFGNPSYIQDRLATYYLPINPQERKGHTTTNRTNSNGALHMGPIGVAINGVVFFNPFDAGSEDATNLMDKCCGHPNPDNQYHYHKYPICINSPWADEGKAHSSLLGWAFDGYPLYGPYESEGVMAKDVTGEKALNAFNMHFDETRGWHYHVTPGKFPYLIGGFWGAEDARNQPPHRNGPPGGGPPQNGQGGFGPPPEGFGPPPGGGGFPPPFPDQK